MKRFFRWLLDVPHLFGKVMVIWCVVFGSGCCFYALRILSRTEKDPAALLAVILAFLGTELGMMFGRDALKGKNEKNNGSEESF